MAWPNDKITLSDVQTKFDIYSFIITTSSGVYDTSLYDRSEYKSDWTLSASSIFNNAVKGILMINNHNGSKVALDMTTANTQDKFVLIPEGIVTDIKIKGKKGHPFDGAPIK